MIDSSDLVSCPMFCGNGCEKIAKAMDSRALIGCLVCENGSRGIVKTINFHDLDSHLFLRKEGGEDAGFNYL